MQRNYTAQLAIFGTTKYKKNKIKLRERRTNRQTLLVTKELEHAKGPQWEAWS